MEWITRPDPEDEVPNIDWLIALFSRTNNYYVKPDLGIKSWAQPVGELKGLLKIYMQPKRGIGVLYLPLSIQAVITF